MSALLELELQAAMSTQSGFGELNSGPLGRIVCTLNCLAISEPDFIPGVAHTRQCDFKEDDSPL